VPFAPPRADVVEADADARSVDRADLRRALADLEAAKERVAREGKRAEEAARLKLIGELVPVLDNLDRSIASGSTDAALLHGVELVRQGLERVLAGYGLERIAALNERFDPAVHEAIAVAPVTDPALHGLITDEVSRGYRIGDKVQRPARVRVGQLVAA
jgi:molecular chaperone GrpE (heat shock protein)